MHVRNFLYRVALFQNTPNDRGTSASETMRSQKILAQVLLGNISLVIHIHLGKGGCHLVLFRFSLCHQGHRQKLGVLNTLIMIQQSML